MPRLDGLATLRRIMAECPTPVVMLSALTQRGAQTTIRALMLGAIDFVAKPSAAAGIRSVTQALIDKIKIAAAAPVARRVTPITTPLQPAEPHAHKLGPRPFEAGDPVIVIGVSTGGPRALQKILSELPAVLPAAIVVVQHMPPGFTHSLAERLDKHSSLTIREAIHGDRLARGQVLLAPGDFHLRLEGQRQVLLDQGPRRNYTRPSVDVTMESAARRHRSEVIGVILTGMGSDGTEGARCIRDVGGRIIAEHESTCVVYGMPRSAIEADLVDRVVPLPDIASTLIELVGTELVDTDDGRTDL
jgi:two-component system chemotaxis response regulator CheB